MVRIGSFFTLGIHRCGDGIVIHHEKGIAFRFSQCAQGGVNMDDKEIIAKADSHDGNAINLQQDSPVQDDAVIDDNEVILEADRLCHAYES